MFFKKKNSNPSDSEDGIVIHIQWGGYYTSKEDGMFGVFRLLDFNRDNYHIQLFQENFDHSPSFSEVKELQPFIWHVPIEVVDLLNKEALALVGHQSLNEQALMGYEEYLRQMGEDDADIKKMLAKLIEYSADSPLRVKLVQSAEGVIVTEI